MSAAPAGTELFPYTFATWVFTLHVDGVTAGDAVCREACDAIRAATEAEPGNAATDLVAESANSWATAPTSRPSPPPRTRCTAIVRADLGEGDRTDRAARIRRYQFASHLPWLARIWERADGAVRQGWLLVERVTDEVSAADPNPWNDVDETRRLPVADFQVLWELDGCTNLYLAPPASSGV
ncbi:MAG: hypothetical protein R3F59_10095 [Myxococcota bacterium]